MVSVYRKNRKASGKLLQTLLKQPVLAGQTVIHQISRQQQSVRLCRPPESSADSACILRQMQIGQSGRIATVEALGEMGRRIRDMGLIPGTTVSVVGRAPLKDPVALRLSGVTVTLRNSEADHITVDVSN